MLSFRSFDCLHEVASKYVVCTGWRNGQSGWTSLATVTVYLNEIGAQKTTTLSMEIMYLELLLGAWFIFCRIFLWLFDLRAAKYVASTRSRPGVGSCLQYLIFSPNNTWLLPTSVLLKLFNLQRIRSSFALGTVVSNVRSAVQNAICWTEMATAHCRAVLISILIGRLGPGCFWLIQRWFMGK